jgi:hypothetical protein
MFLYLIKKYLKNSYKKLNLSVYITLFILN